MKKIFLATVSRRCSKKVLNLFVAEVSLLYLDEKGSRGIGGLSVTGLKPFSFSCNTYLQENNYVNVAVPCDHSIFYIHASRYLLS